MYLPTAFYPRLSQEQAKFRSLYSIEMKTLIGYEFDDFEEYDISEEYTVSIFRLQK
jgi:hypothetical protein